VCMCFPMLHERHVFAPIFMYTNQRLKSEERQHSLFRSLGHLWPSLSVSSFSHASSDTELTYVHTYVHTHICSHQWCISSSWICIYAHDLYIYTIV
jgi:hypothetical protein